MHDATEEMGTIELARRAASDMRELGRLEAALAKDELLADVSAAKSTAMLFGGAVVLAVLGLASLLAALAVALGPMVAVIVGAVLLVAAIGVALAGYKLLPKHPMSATAQRLEADENILEKHLS